MLVRYKWRKVRAHARFLWRLLNDLAIIRLAEKGDKRAQAAIRNAHRRKEAQNAIR